MRSRRFANSTAQRSLAHPSFYTPATFTPFLAPPFVASLPASLASLLNGVVISTASPLESISLSIQEKLEKICQLRTEMEPSNKSRLNLPVRMESSLRIDSVPINFTPPPKITSPSKNTYNDRFNLCRSSSRLQNFNLLEKPSPKEGSNKAYLRLLRSEMFGRGLKWVRVQPVHPLARVRSLGTKRSTRRLLLS